jgi:uncharacterized protein (DUF1810 family)
MTADRYDLKRFLDAQGGIYAQVTDELRRGRKQTHWMWFVFPQIKGLGYSAMAQKYAISSLDEARAYLLHPVLGERLNECTGIVTRLEGRTIEEIFGHPDFLKFHSSLTLFAKAAPDHGVFDAALAKYFASTMDRGTLDRL